MGTGSIPDVLQQQLSWATAMGARNKSKIETKYFVNLGMITS